MRNIYLFSHCYVLNLVEKYPAMTRCLKSLIYLNYLPPVIIHLPLFIDDLKVTFKVLLKQKFNHFIVQGFS